MDENRTTTIGGVNPQTDKQANRQTDIEISNIIRLRETIFLRRLRTNAGWKPCYEPSIEVCT